MAAITECYCDCAQNMQATIHMHKKSYSPSDKFKICKDEKHIKVLRMGKRKGRGIGKFASTIQLASE